MNGRILAGALLVVGAMSVQAHHSFAMFDNEKDVVLQGEVKEFQWTNPHIWIQVNVKGSDGKLTEYSIEGGSPNGLKRQGWTKKSINAGDKISLTMHPLKDGSPGGSFMRATVNGKTLGRGPDETPAAAPAAK